MAPRLTVASLLLLAACGASEDARPRSDADPRSAANEGLDAGARGHEPSQAASGDAAQLAPKPPAEPTNDSTRASAPDAGTAPPNHGKDGGYDLSAELYDPANLPRFELELPPESMAALDLVENDDDPRQDTYVSASFRYGLETTANVGVRLKGEGSFQKLDKKPALKLKFDAFVDDRAFRGLRRMTLNNAFEDPSFVAERLAYDVFRAAGLPAPRCNNALLYINGVFYGVYVNVEAEDKTFLRRWFASDDGNLYEEGQKDFVPGAETAFNLETNESANDRSHLRALIAALQAAKNPETFLDELGAHLDGAQFLRFTAAEAAVNQWDMYAYTVFYVNNLRVYDDPTSGKFHFIPWGMDMSMKPFRDSRKPFIKLFSPARQADRANGPISAGLIFQRCLDSPQCERAYGDAVGEIVKVYQALGMEARANAYYTQIKEHVFADTKKNVCCGGGTLSNQQFEAGFQSVLSTIRGRVAALRADLAAQ